MRGTDDAKAKEVIDAVLGKRFKLRLKRNVAAREAAKATIASVRGTFGVTFLARIGGQVRGRTEAFSTRREAEIAVDKHYNDAMMAWIKSQHKGDKP